MHIPVPAPGSIVWVRHERWRVEHARLHRNVVRLDVVNRERRVTFLAPFDRPVAASGLLRPRYVRPQRAIARLAGLAARTPTARAVLAALDAAVDILPHQLEPVLAVLAGARRLLIADEVGLGKTVQAGLVISELRRRRPSLRALVIVPASLKDQWREELARRFAIQPEVADRHGLEVAAREERYGTSPWSRPGVWLASADYLKQPHVLSAMPVVPWDVVVIDEAHDVSGDSDRHDGCHEIARRSRHVVLLTATPHSGDSIRYARLEGLGQLAGLDDPLVTLRRTRRSLALRTTRRVRWRRLQLSTAEVRALDTLAAFERAVLDAAGASFHDGALLLLSVLRKRALSTMSALRISVERRLSWIGSRQSASTRDWLQPRLNLDDGSDDRDDDDRSGTMAEVGLPATLERAWLGRLQLLTQAALSNERKVAYVARLAARSNEPLVVFTEFRHSLTSIARALARCRRVAVLHGGQNLGERRLSLDRFLHGDATALVATDVAGQGLNLHSRARWVVSFELPWNPVRLEQRIGRVDRIGQRRPVHVTLLVARHAAETGLLSRLAERTLRARQSLGPDTLADSVPPAEYQVATTLLTGAPIEAPARFSPHAFSPHATSSGTWQRSARVVARQLVYRRAHGVHWRAPHDSWSGPAWTCMRAVPGLRAILAGALVVLSVPLVDGAGGIVERRIVCLEVPGLTLESARRLALSTPARELIDNHVQARSARIRCLLQASVDRCARVERAIARHLYAAGCPEEAQPGLFSPRSAAVFDAARTRADDLIRDAEDRIRTWRDSADIEVGPPAIELIVCDRR